jgi:hypothetical protein
MKYTAVAKLTNGQTARWSGECSIISEALADLATRAQRQSLTDLVIHWHDMQSIKEKAPLPCEQRIATQETASCDRREQAQLIGYNESNGTHTFIWSDKVVTKQLATGRRISFNAPPLKAAGAMRRDAAKQAEAVLDMDALTF